MNRERNRLLRDWGACHRLLDKLQLATQHQELLPRVRFLADHFAAQAGWPTGPPDRRDRFLGTNGTKNDRNCDRKKR